jgi:hypothetical protein
VSGSLPWSHYWRPAAEHADPRVLQPTSPSAAVESRYPLRASVRHPDVGYDPRGHVDPARSLTSSIAAMTPPADARPFASVPGWRFPLAYPVVAGPPERHLYCLAAVPGLGVTDDTKVSMVRRTWPGRVAQARKTFASPAANSKSAPLTRRASHRSGARSGASGWAESPEVLPGKGLASPTFGLLISGSTY